MHIARTLTRWHLLWRQAADQSQPLAQIFEYVAPQQSLFFRFLFDPAIEGS